MGPKTWWWEANQGSRGKRFLRQEAPNEKPFCLVTSDVSEDGLQCVQFPNRRHCLSSLYKRIINCLQPIMKAITLREQLNGHLSCYLCCIPPCSIQYLSHQLHNKTLNTSRCTILARVCGIFCPALRYHFEFHSSVLPLAFVITYIGAFGTVATCGVALE